MIEINKHTFVFIDGPDMVGKHEIFKHFSYITKYQFLCYDRSVLSNMVYDAIYNRSQSVNISDFTDACINSDFEWFFFNIQIHVEDIESFQKTRHENASPIEKQDNLTFREKTIAELQAFRTAGDIFRQVTLASAANYDRPCNIHVEKKYNSFDPRDGAHNTAAIIAASIRNFFYQPNM